MEHGTKLCKDLLKGDAKEMGNAQKHVHFFPMDAYKTNNDHRDRKNIRQTITSLSTEAISLSW